MRAPKSPILMLVLLASLAPASGVFAKDLPPQGSRPLPAILQEAEKKNLGHVLNADYDGKGQWEVTVCKQSACQKLFMDTATGAEKSRAVADGSGSLPVHAIPASAIVRSVEADAQKAVVSGLAFAKDAWVVGMQEGGKTYQVRVHPVTGKTIN